MAGINVLLKMSLDYVCIYISILSQIACLVQINLTFEKTYFRGTWVAQLVKSLPSAQVMIPESWDQAPGRAPCSVGSLLLPLPNPMRELAPSFSLVLAFSSLK